MFSSIHLLGNAIGFSDVQYGFWSGSSLQGVAHALAAAGARSEIALEMGTIVKMIRVVLLAPVTVYLSSKFSTAATGKRQIKMPTYVLLFIIVGIITSFGLFNFSVGSMTMAALLKNSEQRTHSLGNDCYGLGR